MKTILIICTLFLAGCVYYKVGTAPVANPDEIKTITGTAENHKDGATIHSESGVYYLDGKTSWNENELGKKITVSGKVIKEKREYVSSDNKGIISQGVPQPEGTTEKFYYVELLVDWKKIN